MSLPVETSPQKFSRLVFCLKSYQYPIAFGTAEFFFLQQGLSVYFGEKLQLIIMGSLVMAGPEPLIGLLGESFQNRFSAFRTNELGSYLSGIKSLHQRRKKLYLFPQKLTFGILTFGNSGKT